MFSHRQMICDGQVYPSCISKVDIWDLVGLVIEYRQTSVIQ
jgi:hypothetical protein